ncbi:hypothetical protein [Acidocella aminolytica]|uniref:Uncharacterized protein n=1 Tax=Acidocella aminolytica 101 = DSM 11237 TaxID=1120923 RepID=A0A0D6PCS1_9PROT|nr:hypothetical protein [Acidocella aminolytica]GAN79018.1 hypothetical protein Aam_015_028 [Acidocella aminolytica 101 = DSM 11237]GBQ38434.1 hypothetical protein AA11237_1796 [Acidocella aminolytica 101 = DSM 11237]SHF37781.1 hypothetical protein SAMN02746095_03036 [Acidocella aminolytica 101 = DSM 11237]
MTAKQRATSLRQQMIEARRKHYDAITALDVLMRALADGMRQARTREEKEALLLAVGEAMAKV